MTEILKTACIQMNSGPVVADNLNIAEDMIREAARQGAKLIATPENTCHIRHPQELKRQSAYHEDDHPGLPLMSGLAKELGVWILVGSFSIKTEEDKIFNRSYLFADQGEIVARYDKVHLFDIQLSSGEVYKESDLVTPGEKAVLAETPWGGLGMSICYDLRFAYLYRRLAHEGAKILAVPAAFTVPTGQAHWQVLLRARAIETGSFVIAPAQTGTHEGGRKTYGHSLIVGPWGEVLAQAGDAPEIIHADLDIGEVEKTRNAIPTLQHDRPLG